MLLLDTHAFIWLCSDQSLLPQRSMDRIRGPSGHLFLSSISSLEVGLLTKAGRLPMPTSVEEFVERNLRKFHIREIPVDSRIALASAALPQIHRDPFDRILVATAKLQNLTIVTKDRTIPTYPGVKTVWD